MPKATKSKATAASVLRSDQTVETHYARHKACESIKDELDALDPQDFIDKNATAIMIKKKDDHDKEAARFRKLAVEQENKSKTVQTEMNKMKMNEKKEFNIARVGILNRQVAAEASLLRANSRLHATLKEKLRGSKYEKTTTSDSDDEMGAGPPPVGIITNSDGEVFYSLNSLPPDAAKKVTENVMGYLAFVTRGKPGAASQEEHPNEPNPSA